MSVIGVEITKDKIKFAYDSQTTVDGRAMFFPQSKVFQVKNLTVGFVGSTSYTQHLKRFLEEAFPFGDNDFPLLKEPVDVSIIIAKFFKDFDDVQYFRDRKDNDGSMFITDGVKVFRFDFEDYGCHEVQEYEFIGTGAVAAEGAYLAGMGSNLIDKVILHNSIKIACKIDPYCGEPVRLCLVEKK